MILAPDSLMDVYQRLADYQTRTGRTTVVRGLSTIRALDPRANDFAQAIRTFLRSAYELWGIHWAILAGDHEAIPVRSIHVTSPLAEDIPTDVYYEDLDGTWDQNGNGIYGEVADSLDMVHDIIVGRLSANTRAEASHIVDRALRYAKGLTTASVGQNLFLAEIYLPQTWKPGDFVSFDAAPHAESLLVRTPSCVAATRLYENSSKFPGSAQFTRTSAIAAIGQNNHVVAHFGHGSRSQLSFGDAVITSADLAAIPTGDSTALWLAADCASAAVDFDCVAERMVRSETGGTMAYVGATRDAWANVNARVSAGIYERLFGASPEPLGDAVEDARALLLPIARNESLERWGFFETILLGVPSMPLWKCPPVSLSVTRPSTVPLEAAGVAVTVLRGGAPAESALVVVWKNGEDYRAVRTDALGQATVPFHPASPGSFSISVTADGATPFLDSLTVTSAAPAVYALKNGAFRDDLGGDSDGTVGAGETFGFGGTIENVGGSGGAGAVTVTLQALTSGVAVDAGSGSTMVLAAGVQAAMPANLRAHALATPNTARSERVRVILSDGVRADSAEIALAVGAATPIVSSNVFDDVAFGDGNGVLDPGETATLGYVIANDGGARARGLTAQVSNPASGVTLLDASTPVADVAAGGTGSVPPLRFAVAAVPSGRIFDLTLTDTYGHSWTFPIERGAPGAPANPRVESSGVDRIVLAWDGVGAGDLLGYRVYRAPNDTSTPQLVTTIPIRRSPAFEDVGLSFLTSYRYQVSAVDSSGNESARSPILLASTTPPSLAGWPASLGQSTSSSVCLADLDGDDRPEILVGAEYLYVFRPDGSDWIDGDQNAVTTGIFSTLQHNIASSPAAADLDFDGVPEIIVASWDDSTMAVYKANGSMMPGWPHKGAAPFWSVPAVGDIDGDGQLDIVVGSNTTRLYAWHADGNEVRDGDSNPATNGVYLLTSGTVISSPAIADLLGDGTREIVFGTSAGAVNALKNGVSLPGWPFTAGGLMSSSPAIGDVIPGGGLEVAMACGNDSVYVLSNTGTVLPGWPQPLELTPGNGRVNSPVLVPLRKHLGDPSLCVVIAGADGTVAAFGATGNTLPGWPVHLGGGTESTPVVADLDGDGSLEVLIGSEDRRLYAFHADGSTVSGFPIETGAEVRGSPAVWDVDGDGASDILVAGWDRQLYAWRYPGAFNATGMAWPMFRHDNWRTGLSGFPILTAVDSIPPEPAPPAPARAAWVEQNRPNPFNPATSIGFSVPGTTPAEVRLRIFSTAGRLVRTLVSRRVEPGYHVARWDGRDERGNPTASGIYVYRAEIGGAIFTRKMTLLR